MLKCSNQCEVWKCLLVETDRQVRKIEFLGAHFRCTSLSELLLEPGEVEIPRTLGVKPVTLVSEAERLLPVSPVSALFFCRALEPPRDRTIRFWLSSVTGWLVSLGEGCCKYFFFQGSLQPKGVSPELPQPLMYFFPFFLHGVNAILPLFTYLQCTETPPARRIDMRMEESRRGHPSLLHAERASSLPSE